MSQCETPFRRLDYQPDGEGEYTARVRREALRKNKHTRNSQATNVRQDWPGKEERIASPAMRRWVGCARKGCFPLSSSFIQQGRVGFFTRPTV